LSEKSNFYLPSIQAVLFDIDGTLVDTEDLHFASWNEILTEYEMVLDRRHYDLNFVGLTSVDIVLRNFAHLPVAARQTRRAPMPSACCPGWRFATCFRH